MLKQESIILLNIVSGIDFGRGHGAQYILGLILHLVDLMLSILDVFSSVLPHNFAELGQRIWGILLVVDRYSSVVTEVYPTDGQEMLNVVLLHQTAEVVFYGFIPAASKGSAVELRCGFSNLQEYLLDLRTDRYWVLDESILINADD